MGEDARKQMESVRRESERERQELTPGLRRLVQREVELALERMMSRQSAGERTEDVGGSERPEASGAPDGEGGKSSDPGR